MSTPREHAIVSPSSLKRTINCPPSLNINKDVNSSSKYTVEGTKAHLVAECMVHDRLGIPGGPEFKDIEGKTGEMINYGADYAAFAENIRNYMQKTSVNPVKVQTETIVNMEKYIDECWGTCDLMFIGDDKLSIADYKYGAGKVDATDNAQLKAYALGAYLSLSDEQQAKIYSIDTYIFQPRASFYNTETRQYEKGYYGRQTYKPSELIEWAQSIDPIIQEALKGLGDRVAGDHCVFCAAKGSCEACRAITNPEESMGGDDFAGLGR